MQNKNQTKAKKPERPTLLSAAGAAGMTGIATRTWWRYHSANRVPACVRIGSLVKWRRTDVERWIEMGCPGKSEFEIRKDSK